jgi:uncharacterized protein (TIGR02996 family)
MDIAQALTQEIIAHPDDDLPRQALADWLEEQGRQDHAEFIRVQLELARIAIEDERRPYLLSRQAWLLARHAKEWGRHLRGLARRWEFRRGLVEGVTLRADRFLAHAEKLFALAPIRHLRLVTDASQNLADCPQLARVSELTLSGTPVSSTNPSPLHALLRSPHLQGLRSLRIRAWTLRREELLAISGLADLGVLELRSCSLGVYPRSEDLALARSGTLARLRHLSLLGWLGPVEWPSLAGRLEVLELRNNQAEGLDFLRRLRASARSTPLRELRVAGAPMGRRPLAELRTSAQMTDLHTLELRNCWLDNTDIVDLVGAQSPRHLVHLDLGGNSIRKDGVESLLRSHHRRSLVYLGLARLNLSWSALALIRSLCSADLPRLAALDLSSNNVTAEAVEELAASGLTEQLYSLDLRNTRMSYQGAAALLAADWPRLALLDVRENDLGDSAHRALRQRFGYTVLY